VNFIDRFLNLIGLLRIKMLPGFMAAPGESSYGVSENSDYLAAETAYEVHGRVHTATRMAMTNIAELPVKLFREIKDGKPEEIDQHDILNILWTPNHLQGYNEFWQRLFGYLFLTENVYIYTQYGTMGLPAEIMTMRTDRMKVLPDEKAGVRGYRYALTSGKYQDYLYDNPSNPKVQKNNPYDASKILHIKGANFTNDYYGMSRITPFTRTINTDRSLTQYFKKFFENNALLGAILESKGSFPSEDEAKRGQNRDDL
jgi:HK97 family phage portal protein